MNPSDIHSEFQSILAEFQRDILPMLRENLLMQGYHYTGTLYNDLHMSLVEKGEENWELEMHMPNYGRMLDKKRPFAAYASAEDLAKWISYKGLDKFRSIPGYDNSNFIPANASERIAWAIVNSKSKIANRYRSFNNPFEWQWFYRPFFGEWGKTRTSMVKIFFDEIPKKVVDQLDKDLRLATKSLPKMR